MKLAYFYRQLNQGGIQRMIVNCANYFAENGHDVSLILMKPKGEFHALLNKNVKIIYFKSIRQPMLYASFSFILRKENFDLLYTGTPDLNIFVIICKAISGSKTKIVISEHNNTIVFFKNMKFSLSKIAFLSIPLLYRFADAIVAVSHGVADSLQKIALIPENKIKIIDNPAYSTLLEEQLKVSVDHEWFKDQHVPLVITVGRLTEAKNHELLIEAMSLLLKKRKVRLMIVGEGHLRPVLQNKITNLNLSESVCLVGFKLSPISWVCKADVFVLSSDYEGFGYVLVEALAAGTTIVSTNCNYGPAEILGANFGYLVPVGDANALAAKIEFALDHPIDKNILHKRATDYSIEKIMIQYNKLFEELLEK